MSDIKVPIKAIVENLEEKHNCNYNDEIKFLMRRFFISLLNLGFIEPKDLMMIVEKTVKKFKEIKPILGKISGLEFYKFENNVLFVYDDYRKINEAAYEKMIFKALSETLLGIDENHKGVSNALNELLGEKAFNMDTTGKKDIDIKNFDVLLGEGHIVELHFGYDERYNIALTLLKQLFLCLNIKENDLIKSLIFNNTDKIHNLFNNKKLLLLFDILEVITLLENNRLSGNGFNIKEIEYINKYQFMINSIFTSDDENYKEFCKLITSKDIREECLQKHKEKILLKTSIQIKNNNTEKDNTFTIVGEDGKDVICEILFTYHHEVNGKDYIAYTDNTLDEEGNTKVYASTFNPDEENPTLLPIETDEEWKIIEGILESLAEE